MTLLLLLLFLPVHWMTHPSTCARNILSKSDYSLSCKALESQPYLNFLVMNMQNIIVGSAVISSSSEFAEYNFFPDNATSGQISWEFINCGNRRKIISTQHLPSHESSKFHWHWLPTVKHEARTEAKEISTRGCSLFIHNFIQSTKKFPMTKCSTSMTHMFVKEIH